MIGHFFYLVWVVITPISVWVTGVIKVDNQCICELSHQKTRLSMGIITHAFYG